MFSCSDVSTTVTGVIVPPFAFIETMPWTPLATRMVSRVPQVAPRKSPRSWLMTFTSPLRLNLPPAFRWRRNNERPSGDRMDPGHPRFRPWRASTRSSDRSQSMGLAPGVAALNTSAWPSGESANEGTSNVLLVRAENSAFPGGKAGKLIESGDDEVVEGRVARYSVVPRKSAAATHPAHPR